MLDSGGIGDDRAGLEFALRQYEKEKGMISFSTLNEYQAEALQTWNPGKFRDHELARLYLVTKLAGEAGEVAEKAGKLIRDKEGLMAVSAEDLHALKLELGDVLWYISAFAHELGLSLEHVAQSNILKLRDRQKRGVIKGSGDNR